MSLNLEIHYDGLKDKSKAQAALQTIAHHLTPTPEIRFSARKTLDDISQLLSQGLPAENHFLYFHLDSFEAGHLARILNLPAGSENTDYRRYNVSTGPNGDSQVRFEIFGRQVSGLGEHDLTIKAQANTQSLTGRMFMLKDWQAYQATHSPEQIQSLQQEVSKAAGVNNPDIAQGIIGMPHTPLGYERQIAEESRHLNDSLVINTAGLIRLVDDFVTQPLRTSGLTPSAVEVQGPYEFNLLIDPKAIPVISQFPSLSPKESLRYTLPLAPDDRHLIGE